MTATLSSRGVLKRTCGNFFLKKPFEIKPSPSRDWLAVKSVSLKFTYSGVVNILFVIFIVKTLPSSVLQNLESCGIEPIEPADAVHARSYRKSNEPERNLLCHGGHEHLPMCIGLTPF